MRILYFASLRTKTGISAEDVSPPASVATVGALIDWLRTQGPGYAEALEDLAVVRVAVNQEYSGLDASIGADDEIALFPPVTGGVR